MYGPRKMLNMLILRILQMESDEKHPLLQKEIMNQLEEKYSVECDRRSVTNNIRSLRELGYDIDVIRGKGCYLRTRELTESEIRLLIDSIFASPSLSDEEAHKLALKLAGFGNKYFKSHVSYIHTVSKKKHTDNKNVMDSIAKLDEAIARGKKVSFRYLRYGLDLKMHPCRDERYVVSPYQMINNRGKYYLIGNYEPYTTLSNYRIDRMTDVKILPDPRKPQKEVEGLEAGLNLEQYLSEHVYMFSGKSTYISFKTRDWMMDALMDSFGRIFHVKLLEGDEIEVSLTCNPDAFFYWAMQYGQYVEVLYPENLRTRILDACRDMVKKYEIPGK